MREVRRGGLFFSLLYSVTQAPSRGAASVG